MTQYTTPEEIEQEKTAEVDCLDEVITETRRVIRERNLAGDHDTYRMVKRIDLLVRTRDRLIGKLSRF